MNKSILKTASVGAVAMSLFAAAAFAGVAEPSKSIVAPVPESFYNAHEFGVSAAALLAVKSHDGIDHTAHRWGADLEFSYFFTRNFGLAVEGEYLNFGRPLWGTALNLYGRFPLGESSRWAPYIFGGAGGLYFGGESRFEAHAGGGIEYRFTPKIGMFLDGRYTWVDGDHDIVPTFGMFRSGFKFVF
jgi:hypothetical protein